MGSKPTDEDFYLVTNDPVGWRFFCVPKLPMRLAVFSVLRRHWTFVPMDVGQLAEELGCDHRWLRQSLFMWKGQLAMAIYCVEFHLCFLIADIKNRRWRRFEIHNCPELPREIGNLWTVSSENSADENLLVLLVKDQLSGFLVVNVFRDFSPLTESIFAVVFDGDYTLPQMFPGDILPPVTIFTGRPNEEPSSMIFCLYKSGFGLIDRLVTFNLDGREWNESRQLTGWQDGLAMQIRLSPESHDSPVVANVDDPNGCRIFFCSVDIQRPMWAFNICCLDVETSCWHRFSRFYVDHFYAHQKINLFLTQDGRLLVTVKYPWDIIREIRLSVTPLQQLCWGSLIASVPGVGQMNADQLKQLGLPHSFLVRYHLLDGEE